MKPTITIEYCPKCNWLLRSAYMAQEFLTTFADDIAAVTLKPSETSGRFSIFVNELQAFDRKEHGGFPEISFLKQLIRDQVNPEKNLGHADKKKSIDSL
jgi:selenoprotein W-related protein